MKHNYRCFFDVELAGVPLGRIVFELYRKVCPKTCENFRALCTGEKGLGSLTKKPLHYEGTIFHRVVKNFMIQGGDFSASNGTGGESIYGGTFEDENFDLKHEQPLMLSMANRGPNTNGSQFFITTQPMPHLDGTHVVFGKVVVGEDIVRRIENVPVNDASRPREDVKIVKCGELVLKLKKKNRSHSDSDLSSRENWKKASKKRSKDRKHPKSHKKKHRKRSRSGSRSKTSKADEVEDLHPLAVVRNINPEEIPKDPSRNFLSRVREDRDADGEERRENRTENTYRRKPRIRGFTRSGRVIKGRGALRYRTPSRSRTRSRTPFHWRKEERRVIKYSEFERLEIIRREKEEEISKREEARKRRHEERPDEEKTDQRKPSNNESQSPKNHNSNFNKDKAEKLKNGKLYDKSDRNRDRRRGDSDNADKSSRIFHVKSKWEDPSDYKKRDEHEKLEMKNGSKRTKDHDETTKKTVGGKIRNADGEDTRKTDGGDRKTNDGDRRKETEGTERSSRRDNYKKSRRRNSTDLSESSDSSSEEEKKLAINRKRKTETQPRKRTDKKPRRVSTSSSKSSVRSPVRQMSPEKRRKVKRLLREKVESPIRHKRNARWKESGSSSSSSDSDSVVGSKRSRLSSPEDRKQKLREKVLQKYREARMRYKSSESDQ